MHHSHHSFSHSRDMTTARSGPMLSHGAGKGDRGPRQGSSRRGGGGHPALRASSVFVATFVYPGSMSDCGGLVSMLKSLSLFLPESIASIRLCVCQVGLVSEGSAVAGD